MDINLMKEKIYSLQLWQNFPSQSVFLFHVIILNVHDQEFADVGREKLFVVTIENLKVMQNVKIHKLKTIVTKTFA